MKIIELTKCQKSLIDDEDFEIVNGIKWFCLSVEKLSYAATNVKLSNGKSTLLLMHRLILGNHSGITIDHINGNGLDNRKSNLRFCTHAQNMANRKTPTTNKSGYKGVSAFGKKWRV